VPTTLTPIQVENTVPTTLTPIQVENTVPTTLTPIQVENTVPTTHTLAVGPTVNAELSDIVAALLTLSASPVTTTQKTKRNAAKRKRQALLPDEDSDDLFYWYFPSTTLDKANGDDAVRKIDQATVRQAVEAGTSLGHINKNSVKRLLDLSATLAACHDSGIVSFTFNPLPKTMCLLGFEIMHVVDPKMLNDEIRSMVERDIDGIWCKAGGSYNQVLKYPTWGVYELSRKLGIKPRFRGPKSTDPGKKDMLYHKEWVFLDDDSFRTARQRLRTGFNMHTQKRQKSTATASTD